MIDDPSGGQEIFSQLAQEFGLESTRIKLVHRFLNDSPFLFLSSLNSTRGCCRGTLLDRDSVCHILRDNLSPTIQVVGCNEKLASTPLNSQVAQYIEQAWAWVLMVFAAVMGSRVMKCLNSFVSRFLFPFLSVLWAFFATMWPTNDPALERGNQPAQNHEEQEVRYVRRIDTGGQRRCRYESDIIFYFDAHISCGSESTIRRSVPQGCNRHGDHRSRSAPVIASWRGPLPFLIRPNLRSRSSRPKCSCAQNIVEAVTSRVLVMRLLLEQPLFAIGPCPTWRHGERVQCIQHRNVQQPSRTARGPATSGRRSSGLRAGPAKRDVPLTDRCPAQESTSVAAKKSSVSENSCIHVLYRCNEQSIPPLL